MGERRREDDDDADYDDWEADRRYKKSRYTDEVLETFFPEDNQEENDPEWTCKICEVVFGKEENAAYQRPYIRDSRSGKIHAICDRCHENLGGVFTPRVEYSNTCHELTSIKLS